MRNIKVTNNSQGQTGPKTQLGKQTSAKNSRKSGIFTKGYLDWENVEQKQQMHQRLCEQWGANDVTSQIFIASLEQAHLEYERIMYAQKLKIDAAMMQLDIAKEFARLANLSTQTAHQLPSWYFMEDDEEKLLAIWLDQVWLQANHLRENFHDNLVPKIAQNYPQLYEEIMRNASPHDSFLQVLGSRFQQTTPTLNLGKLMNEIGEDYRHHLQWAQDPVRYQTIINGLRGNLMSEAMDLEKNSRYLGNAQNRMLKSVQALTALKQIKEKNAPLAVELVNPQIKMHQEQQESQCSNDEGEAISV
jgi:hypothetical protein